MTRVVVVRGVVHGGVLMRLGGGCEWGRVSGGLEQQAGWLREQVCMLGGGGSTWGGWDTRQVVWFGHEVGAPAFDLKPAKSRMRMMTTTSPHTAPDDGAYSCAPPWCQHISPYTVYTNPRSEFAH